MIASHPFPRGRTALACALAATAVCVGIVLAVCAGWLAGEAFDNGTFLCGVWETLVVSAVGLLVVAGASPWVLRSAVTRVAGWTPSWDRCCSAIVLAAVVGLTILDVLVGSEVRLVLTAWLVTPTAVVGVLYAVLVSRDGPATTRA